MPQDCGDGTYTAVVRLNKAGLVTVRARVNGQPLGLPAALRCAPAPLASLALVGPPALRSTAGARNLGDTDGPF